MRTVKGMVWHPPRYEGGTGYYTDHAGRVYSADEHGNAVPPARHRKAPVCADCGALGERTGHQTCPYPKDHP